MENEPPESLSEIPERAETGATLVASNFLAAVGLGGLTATAVMALVMLASLRPPYSAENLFAALFFVGVFAQIFTLIGMLVIGLPVTLVLRLIDAEHRAIYAAIGGIAGFAVLTALSGIEPNDLADGLPFLTIGAAAGFVSALRWGSWRSTLAEARRCPSGGPVRRKRDNPIHDLVH